MGIVYVFRPWRNPFQFFPMDEGFPSSKMLKKCEIRVECRVDIDDFDKSTRVSVFFLQTGSK